MPPNASRKTAAKPRRTKTQKRAIAALPATTASGLPLQPRVRRGIQKYPYAMDADMIVLGESKGLLDCELTLPEDLTKQIDDYAASFGCEPGDVVVMALISMARKTPKGRLAMFSRTNALRSANGLPPMSEALSGILKS